MTPSEWKALVAAKDETIAAKQQVIVVLADVIDDLRAQLAQAKRPTPTVALGRGDALPLPATDEAEEWAAAARQVLGGQAERQGPRFEVEDRSKKLWLDDDEEDLTAALEAGEIDPSEFEEALAQVQAFNTTITVAE